MNVTFGSLILLTNLFLPGILFLRFYYTGEFSKQFNTRVPFIQIAIRSFIPGLLIQVLSLCLYNLIDSEFEVKNAVIVFNELISTRILPSNYSSCTINFLENQIYIFVLYSFSTSIFGVLFGTMFFRIVKRYKLDTTYKILRFKNTWSYIFSGQYQQFERIEKLGVNVTTNHSEVKNFYPYKMTSVDALVEEAGETKMYSGIIIDYDLDAQDNNKLERIYLTNVYRYKFNSEEALAKNRFLPRVEKKEIPGHLFTLETNKLLNLNLTYVPNLKEEILDESNEKVNKNDYNELIDNTVDFDEQETKEPKIKFSKVFYSLLESITFLGIVIFSITLFGGSDKIEFYNFIHTHFNRFQKIVFIVNLLFIFMSIFISDEDQIDKKRRIIALIVTSLLSGIFIFIALIE